MRLYCPQCGALSEFAAAKPNFCHKCGQSFGVASEASEKAPSVPVEQDEQDSTPQEEIPNVAGLEVDISSDTHFQHSFGGLMGTSEGTENQLPKRKAKRVNKKKFLEDFKKEAGSIKRK